ncbi:MAG: hypothetical protein HY903_08855 [Deltaproteobacteria bacterium]|nr:hypothetical protein [Deltaproteobacteria bacterium]
MTRVDAGRCSWVALAFAGAAAVSGCGADTEPVSFAVQIPFAVPLASCTQRTTIGQTLQAILDIGGHTACALAVDPPTLTSSGACEHITVGIVRPLGLGYYLPRPTPGSDSVPLAYVLGFVDLRREQLDAAAAAVPVDLTPGTPATKLLTVAADVVALRGDADCGAVVDATDKNLCAAEAWAKGRFNSIQPMNLDLDTDGTENVVEACAGTLFQ